MLILTIRTDKPQAEIGMYDNTTQLSYFTWEAHRQLAETIHAQLEANLKPLGKELKNIEGIVAYKGPGSFTGLRIGITVANTLAGALNIPIVSEADEAWRERGIERLQNNENEKLALPEYGALPHITQPRK